ncbi:MAG: hypothetical protein ABL907_04410 [Hyphomicrobium sp.]
MDKPTTPPQPKGQFKAYLNRDKKPADKQPMFEATITSPDRDVEFRVPLWAHDYTDPKTGEIKVMYNGKADATEMSALPHDQVSQMMTADKSTDTHTVGNVTLDPRQLVLFPNGFKDEAPDKNRPDLWGAFNAGRGRPVWRIGAWMEKDRYGRAKLTGSTSYPILGKSEAEMQQSDTPNIDRLLAEGTVNLGMPAKGKAKGKGRE